MPALTQPQIEELKLLRTIRDGVLPKYLERNQTDLAHDIARELHEDGMFKAAAFRPVAGRASYPDVKITSRGRERLAELEQLAVPDHASDPAKPPRDDPKSVFEKPLGKLTLVVAGGLVLAAAITAITSHFGSAP